ncbi:MAG: flippase activity-associated protein Agl23 [Chloroflexaceae bacterium]
MALETLNQPAQIQTLNRPVGLAWLTWETVVFALIVLASIIAHLWGLGVMALHHDESIHAWSSWRLYTGAGGFNCWGGVSAPTYCYDPVYHGPSLYYFTALAYFLFGDGDAQARLPMAIAGILMVGSAWWLRPYLGPRGVLVAAALLAFSPSLLYYTRFARHDGLMVLWEVWMFVGALRWLDSGRPGWLYLTAAALALAIATHELYYILLFIFGVFVLMRLLAESRFARHLNWFLIAVIGVAVLLMLVNPRIPVGQGLYFGEKAFLVASAFLLAWLCQQLWDPGPVLLPRLQALWSEQRTTLWVALTIFGGIYLVLYSSFFAHMRGVFDGLYAGLAYWLGSQQEYARGDQPWYYYLMLLPLYEPLAVLSAVGVVVALIVAVARRFLADRRAVVAATGSDASVESDATPAPEAPAPPRSSPVAIARRFLAGRRAIASATGSEAPEATREAPAPGESSPTGVPLMPGALRPWGLYPLLAVFWFWTALIIFSWAGEKMPWLLVHMALPGALLAAWVIARLLDVVEREGRVPPAAAETSDPSAGNFRRYPLIGLVPLVTVLIAVAVGVALWRIGAGAQGQEWQRNLLQGLVPLFIAGGLVYTLLTLANLLGARLVIALIALTLALGIGAYTVRATWMVVYHHPDTPIEPLIYTQTAPEVPRYVADIRAMAINLTRSYRTPQDQTGGLSMPVFIDSGDDSGEGSLAWPLQWYFRDFKNLVWTRRDRFQSGPGPQTFVVSMPDGSTAPAPVVLLYRPHVTESVREALRVSYVQPYGPVGVFNWWFPEGDKCSPDSPGYKRFYYSTWTPVEQLLKPPGAGGSGGCGRDISAEVRGPYAPLLWPFQVENWTWLSRYLLYRELPYPLTPGAREMEVWVRSDLVAGGVGMTAAAPASPDLRLVARQVVTLPAGGGQPTGVAVDAQGNLYVADTGGHRIHVYGPDGRLMRSLGGQGAALGELYEPRGLALDAAGNLYVADTWNARIVKYDPEGRAVAAWGSGDQNLGDGRRATITEGDPVRNAAAPLGLFGPRGVAVDARGNVYIADTGNRRIIVTDSAGTFLYQFGSAGAGPGQFNEPASLAVDAQGNLYVADTWNSRVQVFAPDGAGRVGPIPIVTWQVAGWRPNTYDDPALTVTPDGTVFVSVPARSQIISFNLRGDPLLRWSGQSNDLVALTSPSGLVVDAEGAVWVTDRAANRVLRFVLPDVAPL